MISMHKTLCGMLFSHPWAICFVCKKSKWLPESNKQHVKYTITSLLIFVVETSFLVSTHAFNLFVHFMSADILIWKNPRGDKVSILNPYISTQTPEED